MPGSSLFVWKEIAGEKGLTPRMFCVISVDVV